MKRNFYLIFLLFFKIAIGQTLTPDITSWMVNTTGVTGYSGLPANVQKAQYSENYVYISCSGVPSYTIGPWAANPNVAQNQSYVFKIPRVPQVQSAPKRTTSMGHIAVLKNGVPVYNCKDGFSYNSLGIWNQNAVVFEAISFDAALGHPAQGGRYHHHQNPKKLYHFDSTKHSAIMGYSFDGFPIYGPFGYKNSDGTGGITRITSSYKLRAITQRTTLANGTSLPTNQHGPNISTTYPLGGYQEDYEYSFGYGLLDEHNGRTAKTPEYPNGTYAYYITINADGSSAYPYVIGPTYYGVIATENLGAGKATINETVTEYKPTSNVENEIIPKNILLHQNYPNPFNPTTTINYELTANNFTTIKIYDFLGNEVETLVNEKKNAGTYSVIFESKNLSSGIYFARLTAGVVVQSRKMVLLK